MGYPAGESCAKCGHACWEHQWIVYTECWQCDCRYFVPSGEIPMSLFNWGDFTLSSGKRSPFKIDCDALRPQDWEALANVALCHLRPFSMVEGVPMGGMILATFLSAYARKEGGLLIVDDVFTTGGSMERQRAGRKAEGLVVFARAMPPTWIRPLFMLYEDVP